MSLVSQREDRSRQYSTAGPISRALSRLRPTRSSSGWHPSAHRTSGAASCRPAVFDRRLAAVHGEGSSKGQVSSRALAAVRAAGSWTLLGAARRMAAWSTEFTRMVGGETARLTLMSPARSMASSASQAGLGSTPEENGVTAPPRYEATAWVLNTLPGIPWLS